MAFLSNQRIITKIVGIVVLTGIVALGGVAALSTAMQGANARYHRLLTRDEVGLRALAQTRQSLTGFGYTIYKGTTGNSDATAGMIADYGAGKAKAAQSLALARADLPGRAGEIDAIETELHAVEGAIDKVVDLAKMGISTEAVSAMGDVDPKVLQLNARMVALGDAVEGAAAREVEDLDANVSATAWTVTLAVLLAIAAVGAATVVMARLTITGPLGRLRDVMDRLAADDLAAEVLGRGRRDEIGQMAGAVQVFKDNAVEKLRLEADARAAGRLTEEERSRNAAVLAEASAQQTHVVDLVASGLAKLSGGDLAHRIDEVLPADYEKLRADFNGAMAKLQDTMRHVAASASAIRSGTGEISTASDDLSRRTEQQAASLEETAAALDEITATVRRTAEGAHHARGVVGTARSNAEQSGQVVRQAVEAMGGIERSAREISQIIGVIDEIAFQTNLLALNAGVEAARAGDAGRGFAVVASEVRALAQRSAEAAKEIKGLISTSGQQVAQGVTSVGQAGEALVRIAAQVAELDGIVGEISASAQEQATGLDQVNGAVNQMDQVTQQNAAMVEQSTAASRALAQETSELTRLIGAFRLGGETAPARRPAPAPVPALKSVGRGGALRAQAAPAPASDWTEF